MIKAEKVVGILGGMGPEATVDLMQRIINLTPADDDIDHVRCIVDNNPKVPSRIKAIIDGNGEDPGPCMADMAKRLESWGADFLAIPCNTAHYYYSAVTDAVQIPVINLLDLVVAHVKETRPSCRTIGVLASTAVLSTRLYEKRFEAVGITVVYPTEKFQNILLDVIKEVKAGNRSDEIIETYLEICQSLKLAGVDAAIVACTELGVIKTDVPLELIDAADVLAKKIIAVAKNAE
jgi:aspartate racemase